jgi:hypothetical protein
MDLNGKPGPNVAVSDLDGDGSPGLIVLRVDRSAAGRNRGFYRVGKKLGVNANLASWGAWIEIPNCDSDQNQGAAVAVADFGAAGMGPWFSRCSTAYPVPTRDCCGSAEKWTHKGTSPAAGRTGWKCRAGSRGAIKAQRSRVRYRRRPAAGVGRFSHRRFSHQPRPRKVKIYRHCRKREQQINQNVG